MYERPRLYQIDVLRRVVEAFECPLDLSFLEPLHDAIEAAPADKEIWAENRPRKPRAVAKYPTRPKGAAEPDAPPARREAADGTRSDPLRRRRLRRYILKRRQRRLAANHKGTLTMECFRIDESGYTGSDLLNADQRFQGAAAIAIDDQDAARLIREHFPTLQATELKYRALSRRPANHPRLIALQRDLLTHYKCVTCVCDKRFMLLLMFLDYAVEPFYYERGTNFYEDGQNFALASLLSFAGPTLFGQPAFDKLLASFQHAVKEKTPEALNALVLAARDTKWRELPEALGPLAQYAAPECLSAITTPGVDTDAAFVVLQSMISRLEVMADGAYRVEHDQSKNLLRYHDLLQQFIDHDQEIEFRQSEIATLKFPLKLTEVTQVDSKASPAVQLADVMIGSAIEAGNSLAGLRSGGLDPEAVLSLYAENQFIHMIPSIDFAEQRRFRQGTQAAETIDYFSANFVAPRKN